MAYNEIELSGKIVNATTELTLTNGSSYLIQSQANPLFVHEGAAEPNIDTDAFIILGLGVIHEWEQGTDNLYVYAKDGKVIIADAV